MCYNPRMAEQLLMIWESEIKRTGDNTVTCVARQPLSRMSPKQAAKLLGCSPWTVTKLYRDGILSGWKPGGLHTRKDGRKSNAAIVLDAGSVLAYKTQVSQRGAF